jgi:hypothetical protein
MFEIVIENMTEMADWYFVCKGRNQGRSPSLMASFSVLKGTVPQYSNIVYMLHILG